MIRATAGTWINYATTLIFQVVFAGRFGASREVAAFVVSFGLAVALGGVFTNTVQSVAVPRLVAEDGTGLVRGAVRFLFVLAILAAVSCALLAGASAPMARGLSGTLNLPASFLTNLLLITSGVIFLLVISNELMIFGLAMGQRFLPSMANAIPSITGILAMLLVTGWGVVPVYGAFLFGLLLETVVLVVLLKRPSHLVDGQMPRIGITTSATLVQFLLLSSVTPAEGTVASVKVPNGAAQYYYASRGLAVVQQLIIGGAALSVLADWSTLARTGNRQALRRALVVGSVVVGVLLIVTASVAAVAAPLVVAAVYQRGNFTAGDTALVSRLLQIALPGFCAEGLAIIMSRGLLVMQRNRAVILLGLFNFVMRISCLAIFGLSFGPKGVAAAYSVSWILIASAQAIVLAKSHLLDLRLPIVKQGLFVSAGTAGVAAFLIVGSTLPVVINGAIVMAVFGALFLAIAAMPTWRLRWQQ